MLTIPSSLQIQFQEYLRNRTIPNNSQTAYLKWLRYYLDFCQKYHFPETQRESLPHFLKKLQEKRQTQVQQEQAVHAIGLYYEILTSVPTPTPSQELTRVGIFSSLPERESVFPSWEGEGWVLQAFLRPYGNPPLTPPRRGIRRLRRKIPTLVSLPGGEIHP